MSDLIENAAGEALAATAPVRPEAPTFTELGARAETVEALAAAGITRAFAIQEYALPIALRGSDLIGQAPTGTGKTLGFGIPLLERVFAPAEGADGVPQALVVVPTRELGLQVAKDLAAAGSTRGVRVLPIYGGVAYEPQIDALRKGVEILVGTPGRLLDLAKQKHLRLDRVHALVLDEADRMLDLGFLDDVERILAMLPEDRQTMLFSATMPDPIVTLARRFLRHPVTIHAGHTAETGPSPQTKQLAYRTHSMNKVEVVARILQARGRGLTMIFTRTKRAADRVAEDLDFRGFAVAAVHGDLGQGARERALRAFRAGKIDILVATDVAARGPRRLRRHARHQLRLPGRPGHLHAPHRPHRPGRRHRCRGDVRRLGRHAALADHRQDARAGHAGAAGDLPHVAVALRPTSTSRPTSPAPCRPPSAPAPGSPPRSRKTWAAAAAGVRVGAPSARPAVGRRHRAPAGVRPTARPTRPRCRTRAGRPVPARAAAGGPARSWPVRSRPARPASPPRRSSPWHSRSTPRSRSSRAPGAVAGVAAVAVPPRRPPTRRSSPTPTPELSRTSKGPRGSRGPFRACHRPAPAPPTPPAAVRGSARHCGRRQARGQAARGSGGARVRRRRAWPAPARPARRRPPC